MSENDEELTIHRFVVLPAGSASSVDESTRLLCAMGAGQLESIERCFMKHLCTRVFTLIPQLPRTKPTPSRCWQLPIPTALVAPADDPV